MFKISIQKMYILIIFIIFISITFPTLTTNNQIIVEIQDIENDFIINTSFENDVIPNEINENIINVLSSSIFAKFNIIISGFLNNEILSNVNISLPELESKLETSTMKFTSDTTFRDLLIENGSIDNSKIYLIHPFSWNLTNISTIINYNDYSININLLNSDLISDQETVIYIPIGSKLVELFFKYSFSFLIEIDIPKNILDMNSISEIEEYLKLTKLKINDLLFKSFFSDDYTTLVENSLSYLTQQKSEFSNRNYNELLPILPLYQLLIFIFIALIINKFFRDKELRKILWEKGATIKQIVVFTIKSETMKQMLFNASLIASTIIIFIVNRIPKQGIISSLSIFIGINILLTLIFITINTFGILFDDIKIEIKREIPIIRSQLLLFLTLFVLFIMIGLDILLDKFPRTFSILTLYFNHDFLKSLINALLLLFTLLLVLTKSKHISKLFKPKGGPVDLWANFINRNYKMNLILPLLIILLSSTVFSMVIFQEVKDNEIKQVNATYLSSDRTYQYNYFPKDLVNIVEKSAIVSDFGLIHRFTHDKLLDQNDMPIEITFIHNLNFFTENYNFQKNHFTPTNNIISNLSISNNVILDKDFEGVISNDNLIIQKFSNSSNTYLLTEFKVLGYSNYRFTRNNIPSMYLTNSTIDINDITDKSLGDLYVNFKITSTEQEIEDFYQTMKLKIGYEGFIRDTDDILSHIGEFKDDILYIDITIINLLLPIMVFGLFSIDRKKDKEVLQLLWVKGIYKKLLKSNLMKYTIINFILDTGITGIFTIFIFLITRSSLTNFKNMFPLIGFEVYLKKFSIFILVPLFIIMITSLLEYNRLINEVEK